MAWQVPASFPGVSSIVHEPLVVQLHNAPLPHYDNARAIITEHPGKRLHRKMGIYQIVILSDSEESHRLHAIIDPSLTLRMTNQLRFICLTKLAII